MLLGQRLGKAAARGLSTSQLVADVGSASGSRDSRHSPASSAANRVAKNSAGNGAQDGGADVVPIAAVWIDGVSVLVILLVVAIAVIALARGACGEREAHAGSGRKAQD